MPWSSPTLCSRCNKNPSRERYCKSCRSFLYQEKKEDLDFYKSKRWEYLRVKQLSEEPFCQWLMPNGRPCNDIASEVDHIIPRKKGGSDRLENLQSLCSPHHSKKTYSENLTAP